MQHFQDRSFLICLIVCHDLPTYKLCTLHHMVIQFPMVCSFCHYLHHSGDTAANHLTSTGLSQRHTGGLCFQQPVCGRASEQSSRWPISMRRNCWYLHPFTCHQWGHWRTLNSDVQNEILVDKFKIRSNFDRMSKKISWMW